MSQRGKSAGWFVAPLVLFFAAASCAGAAVWDDGYTRASKATAGSSNGQPASSKAFLASSNVLAGGIGVTLTLLSLGSLGYAWRRIQATDIPVGKGGGRRYNLALRIAKSNRGDNSNAVLIFAGVPNAPTQPD